ncbi:MAG: transcriptional regulator, AraC family [Paenibacillus sp.]|nr:transcriptional regulator, AraC family [Paenibacillus sp.]
MTHFPIFQDSLRLNNFKKGELPLYITHYSVTSSYPVHHHEFVEISLVTEGSGTEIINGAEHQLKPGSICVLLPHHLHALTIDAGKPLRKFCVMFDINLLFQAEFSEVGQWLVKLSDDSTPYYDLPESAFESLMAALSSIESEYTSDTLGKQGFMRIKLLETIYLFFRNHPDFTSATKQAITTQPAEWEFIKYVNTHFMEEALSLEHVANRFGVSIFVVRNSFKRLIGKNFLEYLHLLRVRRASSLLAATEMSISEIAYDVGFSSLRSFTRVFKETLGMSASDFRDTHRVTAPEA